MVRALAVAGVGTSSVAAFSVSQRTSEMGIRIALGARTSDILDLVVGEGLRVVAVGIGIGLLAAFGLVRLVASLLFGVSPYDASVYIGTSSVLCALGLAACLIPAWRAAKLDPLTSLRSD